MKIIVTVILVLICTTGNAQPRLTPGKESFEKKWIRNEIYQMTWFAMKDTAKFEMGEVMTQVLKDKNYLTIVTTVNMKNSKAPWVDTTIASIKTLSPVRHASYNMQRDMVLDFGKIVTGYYHDKQKQQDHVLMDTTTADYFDSNLYPALIAWLPLTEGYKQDISIYEYNPAGKMGIIKASIKQVSSGTYASDKSGTRDVWIVTVADEIGDYDKSVMVYYIDKNDRRLWKQEINAGGRKMLMQRKEL